MLRPDEFSIYLERWNRMVTALFQENLGVFKVAYLYFWNFFIWKFYKLDYVDIHIEGLSTQHCLMHISQF